MNFRVTCWVNPQSKFELAQNNKAKELCLILCDAYGSRPRQAFKNAEKGHENMILKDFRLQLNHDVDDVKAELMPMIFKNYPEAQLSSWDRV